MNHPLPDMMGQSIAKIKDMVDVNTIIGDPIVTPEGVTIIPVSKVKVGYAGGGSGSSVSITPVAFLVVKGESVRLMPVAEPASNSLERLVEMLPELIDQVSSLAKKKEPEKTE